MRLLKQYAALFEIEDTELEFRRSQLYVRLLRKQWNVKRVLVVCVLSWRCSTRNYVRTASTDVKSKVVIDESVINGESRTTIDLQQLR